MALINNNYVLVTEESVDSTVDTTSHPTEQGLPLSDTLRQQPIGVSLSGKIVDVGKVKAQTIISKLKTLQKAGSLITYIGQVGTINNLQIQSFNTNYNNKNNGGADFDMSLKEVRIAKNAYKQTQTARVNQIVNEKPTIKVGSYVYFLGGNVYVSSDATKPSANRLGGSYCQVTKVSSLSTRKHIYHLISADCKYGNSRYVYGWVDATRVATASKSVSKVSSKNGTQQALFQ